MTGRIISSWASKNSINWLESVLCKRFGIEIRLYYQHPETIQLLVENQLKEINIRINRLQFIRSSSDLPICNWDAISEGWHSILGSMLPAPGESFLETPLIKEFTHGHIINYDILGLTYWALSRQEEVNRNDLDNHGRFPATSSHAYKYGYLERPIVDEWLHILRQVIQRTWPGIQLKQHQFSIKVSHDVDSPSRYGFCSTKQLTRTMGGDIIKRSDFKSALLAPWIRLNTQQTLHPVDPYNTFDWIMDVSEQHNLKSAFYFICGGNAAQDADYELEHPAIRALIRRIHERGHEIGLHPSYNTYQNPEYIVQEAHLLRRVCTEEAIEQQEWGGRMHYLRWEQPTTLNGWEQAKMSYDSTLSYADRPGFRCGTCFEYTAFNPVKQEVLGFKIRPLIAMECTVIADTYMNLGYTKQAVEKFLSLKETCRKVRGTFTLLWHNSNLINRQDKLIYRHIIEKSFSLT